MIVIFLVGWGIMAGLLSYSGAFEGFPSSGLLSWGLFVPPGIAICTCGIWPPLCEFTSRLSLRALTLAEAPRVIGGTYLLWQYTRGTLPPQFALPTGISDIVFGLSAIPAAFLLLRTPQTPKPGFLTWHILSFGFLLISSFSGMLTSPAPLHSFPASMVPVFLGPLMILIEMAVLARISLKPEAAFRSSAYFDLAQNMDRPGR
jgi:hypothetical protein